MKLLLIDTCGETGTVALADTAFDPILRAAATLPGRTASERLIATIRDLAAGHHATLDSLDAIVVVSGPGSFTGVRVGLSAAKGLCEALGLPLVALSRLAVLAATVPASAPRPHFTLLDAGRGEFYLRTYFAPAHPGESLVTRDQLLAAIEQTQANSGSNHTPPVLITCEPAVAESLAHLHPLLLHEPAAQDALPLAIGRFEARDFDDIATIDANYLRRTDAEIFAKSAHASAVEAAR